MSEMRDAPGDTFTRPDPSRLTTEQYNRGQEMQRRELQAMRELLVAEMRAIERIHEEKFIGLETRFLESKAEGKAALEAALRSAQSLVDVQNKFNTEASEKSERSFTKQIDAVMVLVNDLKERFVGSIGEAKGSLDNTTKLIGIVILIVMLSSLGLQIASEVRTPVVVGADIAHSAVSK